MNDPMLLIWESLKSFLGFDGAVAFLYCGLAVLLPLTLYRVLKAFGGVWRY